MNLSLLYRGPLASCNYDCPYCPFAKRRDTPEQLRGDREALGRFVQWCCANPDGHQLSVLFTPWGEGLTRLWYRTAILTLASLSHVDRVAIQTNLAARVAWLGRADEAQRARVALWATYHPGQVTRDRFLSRCAALDELGVRYSVGIVGLPEHLAEARRLRAALRPDVYLWVNAADGHTYDEAAEKTWAEIDPHFGFSVRPHASLGHECRAGESALSVLGDGTVRRCHFVPTPLGNLYDGSYLAALRPRPCENSLCDCHIGYVHLKRLPLYEIFAGGVLERIPATWGVPPSADPGLPVTSRAAGGTPPR
jgi:MoaA/NifB/PqqE/SkfB family radical SAM enzyme